jgi:hypothetical protein
MLPEEEVEEEEKVSATVFVAFNIKQRQDVKLRTCVLLSRKSAGVLLEQLHTVTSASFTAAFLFLKNNQHVVFDNMDSNRFPL